MEYHARPRSNRLNKPMIIWIGLKNIVAALEQLRRSQKQNEIQYHFIPITNICSENHIYIHKGTYRGKEPHYT
jgi:hypothetical protein